MKSTRRHELDTNVLAARLTEWIEKIKPYSWYISVTAIIVVVVAVVLTFRARSQIKQQERAWGEFTYALTSFPPQIESLRFAAEDHPGTRMETWSNLTWADYQLADASRKFFRDRATAMEQIASAQSIYESLADASVESDETSELLRERAKLGLARASELNGDLEKAREMYDQVGGPFAQIAKARSLALSEPDTESTFAWLATAVATTTPSPAGPGTPGQKPLFDTDFTPAPPGSEGTPDGESAPTTIPSSTQPDPESEMTDEGPIDFSLDETEPTEDSAAETPDAPKKTGE